MACSNFNYAVYRIEFQFYYSDDYSDERSMPTEKFYVRLGSVMALGGFSRVDVRILHDLSGMGICVAYQGNPGKTAPPTFIGVFRTMMLAYPALRIECSQ